MLERITFKFSFAVYCRYLAGVHPSVHVRADIAVPATFDESGRIAAAESADAVSIAHEGDAGERPSGLRQRAQARSAYDRVELGTDISVGAYGRQQRAAYHGKTYSRKKKTTEQLSSFASIRRVIEETTFLSLQENKIFPLDFVSCRFRTAPVRHFFPRASVLGIFFELNNFQHLFAVNVAF